MSNPVKTPKVTIGVLTYNHENYIEECLSSVITQSGKFDLTIIIVNDRSKDQTDKKIKNFLSAHKGIDVTYVVNEENIGAQKSIYKIFNLIKDTEPDYWAYIEGDDKYLDSKRTQKHIDNLMTSNGAIISYNKLLLIDEKSDLISKHEPYQLSETLSTERLAEQNHIGSFCATFYSAKCFAYFDLNEFKGLTVYDWFFNIWMSQFGSIRLLPEYLSGYRQHSASVWSSKSQTAQYAELIQSIDNYNKKLNFLYDKSFQSYKRNLINQLFNIGSGLGVDIAIMSDNFSVSKDSFTDSQITYILNDGTSNVILHPGSAHKKDRKTFLESVKKYKQEHPELAAKVIGYDGEYSVEVRTIYALSIDDAYHYAFPIARRHGVPFVFQISSSDEGTLDDDETIKKLRKVLRSIHLRKVIVHSQHAKEVLMNKKLYPEEGIALIPSSVSQKILGSDNIYGPEQIKSYLFQINDLLRKSASGDLRSLAPASIVFLVRAKRSLVRRIRTLVKRNKFVHLTAKTLMRPLHGLINRLKSVK